VNQKAADLVESDRIASIFCAASSALPARDFGVQLAQVVGSAEIRLVIRIAMVE
jgi:hypothetical protein